MIFQRGTRILLPFLSLILFACSDSTAPSTEGPKDGGNSYDGNFDPGDESFVLKRLDIAPPGVAPVYVDLIGSNLHVDAAHETVSIDVALRNGGSSALYAPGVIWLDHFVPGEVVPINADFIVQPLELPPSSKRFGYDYSGLLGGDDILEPAESSEPKSWVFRDPGLGSFAFEAVASFSLAPERPFLGGVLFLDENRNGIRDNSEGPYGAGGVTVEDPDGNFLHASPDESGRYRIYGIELGLYRVRYASMLACIACECVTTPDPREVLITPGPDGQPQSFEHADIGIYPGSCFDPPPPPGPPVLLTDAPPDSIQSDPYGLIGVQLIGETLHVRVGFSGCGPEHPFELFAGVPLHDPYPAQTWMRLSHDDLGELCAAAWERTLVFDLHPLVLEHVRQYGAPGSIQLSLLEDPGSSREFILHPELEVVTGTVLHIDDQVPADGGVVIELARDDNTVDRLLFSSLFTFPAPPPWRWDLYQQVIAGLEVGDVVRAAGVRIDRGLSLRELSVQP